MRRVLGLSVVVLCCFGFIGSVFPQSQSDQPPFQNWFHRFIQETPRRGDIPNQNYFTRASQSPAIYPLINSIGVKMQQGSGDDWVAVKFDKGGVVSNLSLQYPDEALRIVAKPLPKTSQVVWSLTVDGGNGNQNIVQLASDPTDPSVRMLKLSDASEVGKPHQIMIGLWTPETVRAITLQNVVFTPDPCTTPIVITSDPYGSWGDLSFTPTKSLGLNTDYQASTKEIIDRDGIQYPFSLSGGKAPYAVQPVVSDKVVSAAAHAKSPWQLIFDGTPVTTATSVGKGEMLELTGGSFYAGPYTAPGAIQEDVNFKISDQCGHESTVVVKYDIKYPSPNSTPLSELQSMKLSFITEWTDNASHLQVGLEDSGGNWLAQTSAYMVDGDDPTSFDVTWPLILGYMAQGGMLKLSDINKVKLNFKDPDVGEDMTYNVTTLTIVSKYWYATSTQNAAGEVDDAYKSIYYLLPDNFIVNASGSVWQPRPHPGDPNQL